jgi:group II intron reverse transcriptase/maturase
VSQTLTRPSRGRQIPKKNGGTRPLAMLDFYEKLVQDVLRALLEAYYEPCFRNSSHGFRTGRGCHTALTHIKQTFRGTTWLIEGDIRGCFNNINHQVLLDILAKDIHDGRLLNLIRWGLEAGIVEEREYKRTYSGTPQGGILSPLLSNIYLHELDVFVEDVLIPQYTRGKWREPNPKYNQYTYQIVEARKRGDLELAHQLEQERRKLPSKDTHDPNYRRLHYVRYADDFLLGFAGPKSEAEAIKTAIGDFLRERLNLEMNTSKTLITHARTEEASLLCCSSPMHKSSNTTKNAIAG